MVVFQSSSVLVGTRKHNNVSLSAILLLLLGVTFRSNAEVVQLTDVTFEHQTQATTGATTGSWLLLFHSSSSDASTECSSAKEEFQIVDRELSDWLYDNSIVLGSIDVTHEMDTARRFSIGESIPTVYYIHKGSMYKFPFVPTTADDTMEGEGNTIRNEKITEKFQTFLLQSDTTTAYPIPPLLAIQTPEFQQVINVVKKAMAGENGLIVKIIIITLIVSLVGLIGLLVAALIPKKSNKAKKN